MREKIQKLLKSQKAMFGLAGAVIIALAVFAVISFAAAKEQNAYEKKIYATGIENLLADEVRTYVGLYSTYNDEEKDGIADEAVTNYKKVLASGVTTITEDYTSAISANIKNRFLELSDKTEEQPTDEQITFLSNGVNQIIWEYILKEIEESGIESQPEYAEQYTALSESLQEQINALKDRNTKLSITANIPNTGVGEEELEAAKSELYESYGSDLDSALKSIHEEMNLIKSEMSKEIDKEISSIKPGANGQDGKDGKDGEAGATGAAGKDGATTYIAYAEDADGKNARETPTEQTKYIGTVTSNTGRPKYSSSKWTWTQYKDAVISYDASSNTLKIIQY